MYYIIVFCKLRSEFWETYINHKIFYKMKINMSKADRLIRLVVAAVVAILYFRNVITGALGVTLLIISGVFVLTSVVGVCPLYSILKISSCQRKSDSRVQ